MTKSQRSELTFDGFGINGPDEYRTRLATFSNHYTLSKEIVEKYGHLFAASPDLLEALEMVEKCWSQGGGIQVNPESPLGIVRAAIAKAKGQS